MPGTAAPHLHNQSDAYAHLNPPESNIPKAGRHVANLREKERLKREEEERRLREIEESVAAGGMSLDRAKGLVEVAARNPDSTVAAVSLLSKLNGWTAAGEDPTGRLRAALARRRDAAKPLPDPIPHQQTPFEAEIEAMEMAKTAQVQ